MDSLAVTRAAPPSLMSFRPLMSDDPSPRALVCGLQCVCVGLCACRAGRAGTEGVSSVETRERVAGCRWFIL